jgi:hypothetical protein
MVGVIGRPRSIFVLGGILPFASLIAMVLSGRNSCLGKVTGARICHRRSNMARWKLDVNYRHTGSRWLGVASGYHFAVRWTGRLRIHRNGHYWFGTIFFYDGSKLWQTIATRSTMMPCMVDAIGRCGTSSCWVAHGETPLCCSMKRPPEKIQDEPLPAWYSADDGGKLRINNRYNINR